MQERQVSLYLLKLEQELEELSGPLASLRQALDGLMQQQRLLKTKLQTELTPPPVNSAQDVEQWMATWNWRNVEYLRLEEEEFRLKNRIYAMQGEISAVWRKQEVMKRLLLRQRQREAVREQFRSERELQDLITAGQPPP
jgi:hypothetical protein